MAIQALVALADVFTQQVVDALVDQLEHFSETAEPKLVTEVDDSETSSPTVQYRERPAEVRLKVGEALLQVVRLIGPLIPKYKLVLLNTFLRGTKDKDPFVRASCLHNLGELCGLLRYSLDSVAFEVRKKIPVINIRESVQMALCLFITVVKLRK